VQLRQNDAAIAKSSSLSKSKPANSATQSSNYVSCCTSYSLAAVGSQGDARERFSAKHCLQLAGSCDFCLRLWGQLLRRARHHSPGTCSRPHQVTTAE